MITTSPLHIPTMSSAQPGADILAKKITATEKQVSDTLTHPHKIASPIQYTLIPTTDSESFRLFGPGETGIPLSPHPGAYQAQRKHDIHTGIDLYCEEGTPVFSIEDGVVVGIIPFTGKKVGMEWWLDTDAVLVEGRSGVFLYGEIESSIAEGMSIRAGEQLGSIKRVLRNNKGRPTSMLHLELMQHGSRQWYSSNDPDVWNIVQDPTPYLMRIVES